MKRINTIAWCIFVSAVGCTIISGQQAKAGLRKIYEDSTSILQTWQGPKSEQEYLLSGPKMGLSVGLTFNGSTPTEARINLGVGKSIRVQSAGERLVTSLFESGADGEISVLYDLDTSGSWDARTSRSGKCAIFFDAAWHQATDITGILSGTPQALVDGVQYKFSAGAWKPSAEKGNSKHPE
jgi:hypothetical protein